MKSAPECVRCFISDLYGAIESLGLNEEISREIMEEGLRFLSENINRWDLPSFYITELHRILKRKAKMPFPFKELRRRTNEICLEILRDIEKEMASFSDEERIKFSIKWAIAGNHLDFRTAGRGYKDAKNLKEELLKEVEGKIQVDDTEKFLRLSFSRVLYIHDNVGEIVLDIPLIKELKRKGVKVFSALRGGPITSDATVEDGREVGIDKFAEIVEAGPDTLGISWEEMTPQMRKLMNDVHLIVSKGQANYYVLITHKASIKPSIFFLLKTKCSYISKHFGYNQKSINVAKLLFKGREAEK